MPPVERAAHAGSRDLLITVERLREVTSDSNFPTEDWGQPFQAWAYRDFVSLEERIQSERLMASAVLRWEVAYQPDLDPDRIDVANKRRIMHGGRVHNILAAEMRPRPDGRAIILTTQVQVG